MIVDDPPTFRQLLEDQGEKSSQRLLAGHDLPAPADIGAVWTQHVDVDLAEGELAHLAAFGLIALPVALEGRLPATRLFLAGIETEFRRLPIAGHEPFEIALVPGNG